MAIPRLSYQMTPSSRCSCSHRICRYREQSNRWFLLCKASSKKVPMAQDQIKIYINLLLRLADTQTKIIFKKNLRTVQTHWEKWRLTCLTWITSLWRPRYCKKWPTRSKVSFIFPFLIIFSWYQACISEITSPILKVHSNK